MIKTQNNNPLKTYDPEERTYNFTKECRDFVNNLPKTLSNFEYSKQLIRSSGSVAANYIEANEAISKKDFVHRIKICRKETKESRLWLNLCDTKENVELTKKQFNQIRESTELMKIFGSIIEKSKYSGI